MDHYCCWVNNVVGLYNHKYFILFLFYTAISEIIDLGVLIRKFIWCSSTLGGGGSESANCDHLYSLGLMIYLCLLVGFTIFTFLLLYEQFDAINYGQTKIDKYKHNKLLRERNTSSNNDEDVEFSTSCNYQYKFIPSRVVSPETPTIEFDEFNEVFGGVGTRPRLHWFLPLSIKFPNKDLECDIRGYITEADKVVDLEASVNRETSKDE